MGAFRACSRHCCYCRRVMPTYHYSSLESVIEQNKEAYYLALRQTQGTIRSDAPNWQPWLVFFLRSLPNRSDDLKTRWSGKNLCWLPCRNSRCKIVEFAREHGRVTIGEAIKLTGASRNTLKQHFRSLVELGHLNHAR